MKYIRDDKFIYEHMLDDATRTQVDQAWNDLYASFEYHDNYLQAARRALQVRPEGQAHRRTRRRPTCDAMPAEARQVRRRRCVAEYKPCMAAQAAARPRHVEDCLEFASRAWRRPLTEKEKQSLRAFYDKTHDRRDAITARRSARCWRACWSRPAFLYRGGAAVGSGRASKPLTNWEMASRLSFFLWSSIPDDELRRAAAAGELSNPQQLRTQVKRMLADPKARRLATEFFGQWLGFYHFDQFKRRRHQPLPRVHRRSEGVDVRRGGLVLRAHHPQGPSGARDPVRRLHVPQRSRWPSSTA